MLILTKQNEKMVKNLSLPLVTNLLLNNSLANNKDKLSKTRISTFHSEIYLKYSSVNVLSGKQGKGKTFTIDKELVKLSLVESDVHLVIIVTIYFRVDEAFKSLKENITIPYVYASYEA